MVRDAATKRYGDKRKGVAAKAIGLGASLALVMGVSACAAGTPDNEKSAGGDELKKVSVITDILTTTYTPLYTAVKMGYFEKHGLDVEITTLQSGSTITQVMQSGSADIAASGGITQALAVKQGAEFTAILTEGTASPELCVRPEWAKEHDLTSQSSLEEIFSAFKGSTVAVTGVGGTPDLVGKYLIKKYGHLNPESDVTTVALGSPAAIATAFKQDSVDINLASPPQCEAIEASGDGMVLLKPSQIPVFAEIPYAVIYASTSYFDKNPEIAKAFAAAMVDALKYVHANPDKVVDDVLTSYFPTVKADTLRSVLKDVLLPQMPKDGKMTKAGWDTVNEVLAPVNDAPLDTSEGKLWTNKYLPAG